MWILGLFLFVINIVCIFRVIDRDFEMFENIIFLCFFRGKNLAIFKWGEYKLFRRNFSNWLFFFVYCVSYNFYSINIIGKGSLKFFFDFNRSYNFCFGILKVILNFLMSYYG